MGFLVDLVFIPIHFVCGIIGAILGITLGCLKDLLSWCLKVCFRFIKFIFHQLTTKRPKPQEYAEPTLYQKQESQEFNEDEWVVCGKLDRSSTQE